MIGYALCSEAARQLRADSREQADQTIHQVKKIIVEADTLIAGAVLPHSTANKLRELLADLRRLLEKVERSED
jgi:molecular chaperone DnaK (HSP70)